MNTDSSSLIFLCKEISLGSFISLIITEVDSGTSNVFTVALSSTESINWTSSCDLAFTGYSGCQNGAPNNYVLYDEIQVYNFAI